MAEKMRPLLSAASALLVLGLGIPASAQQPPIRKPGGPGRFARPQGLGPGQRPNDLRRAREVLLFYLKDGMRKPFVAEQTTRILSDMVRESQLVVKHGGPGKERMEFLSPAALKGEIILQVGGRIFNYKPSQNRIFEGVAPVEVAQMRSKEFMQDMRSGRIGIRLTGSEIVAGQNASIVEIRGDNGGKRLWIDDKTGVRLRTDELNAQGTVIQTSYFTKVEYEPVFEPADFLPRSLPAVPHEAQFPTKPPLPSVLEAQQQVAYPIREPSLPDGCRLTGVWVIAPAPGREVTILRYTDGVTTFALFHQLAPRALLNSANRGPAAPVRRTNGVIHWVGGDRQFTLLGNVRREAARQIVDSLR
jgi:hypothetical protein